MSSITQVLTPTTTTASVSADTSTPHNRCKRCHRKIKSPQEYGRTCARKMRTAAGITDSDLDKANITRFDIIMPVGPRIFASNEEGCGSKITSTPELIARLENKTASVGMCWACRKQRRCETPKTSRPLPVVVCTAFHEFHYMRA